MSWVIEDDYEIKIGDVENGAYSGEYISLGGSDDSNYCSVSFDGVGSPDLRESTYELSGGDGIRFGVEHYGAINWTITGSIHGSTNKNIPGESDAAWSAWSDLYRAWVAYPGRLEPRAVIPLYFKRPGREEMVVYGRPARIDPSTTQSHAGFISYTALFRQSDPRFYAAQEQSATIELFTSVPGGLLMNDDEDALVLPFTTTAAVPRAGYVVQDGDVATDPVITFTGPVTNPTLYLYVDGAPLWEVSLIATLASGLSVTIDTRQWERSIQTADGASFAGSYRGNRLQDVTIPPGPSELEYSGIDETGTSSCTVTYRNAWSST